MAAVKKYVDIGNRLVALREARFPEMSKTDYARMIEAEYTQYLNWESGLNRPLPDQAAIICDKLGASLDFIYLGKEDALSQNTAKALSERLRLNAQSRSSEMPET